MRTHGVQCLLMGGQACVFYGAAAFGRDIDLALLSTPDNLERFRAALDDLEAECIALPPFEADYRMYWQPLWAELEALRHRHP